MRKTRLKKNSFETIEDFLNILSDGNKLDIKIMLMRNKSNAIEAVFREIDRFRDYHYVVSEVNYKKPLLKDVERLLSIINKTEVK